MKKYKILFATILILLFSVKGYKVVGQTQFAFRYPQLVKNSTSSAFLISRDFKHEDLKIEIDNGTFKNKGFGEYDILPTKVGNLNVKTFARKKGKWKDAGTYRFFVKDVFDLELNIGQYKNFDTIPKHFLDSAKRINLNIEFDGRIICGVRFDIKSFNVVVLRNDSLIYSFKNESATFNNPTKEIFRNLKPNDRISFMNIKYSFVENKNYESEDFYFYLK